MKQLLQQYASYHIWANERLLECINGLSDEQIHREVVSSFPGIYKLYCICGVRKEHGG
ncbi:MAG: hypothetical protein WDM71_04470 [Ferruginibacter sp.]